MMAETASSEASVRRAGRDPHAKDRGRRERGLQRDQALLLLRARAPAERGQGAAQRRERGREGGEMEDELPGEAHEAADIGAGCSLM